jgi:hypothetical protein
MRMELIIDIDPPTWLDLDAVIQVESTPAGSPTVVLTLTFPGGITKSVTNNDQVKRVATILGLGDVPPAAGAKS